VVGGTGTIKKKVKAWKIRTTTRTQRRREERLEKEKGAEGKKTGQKNPAKHLSIHAGEQISGGLGGEEVPKHVPNVERKLRLPKGNLGGGGPKGGK